MPHHRIHAALPESDVFTITGPEVAHARRVKRLETGGTVEILNGAGTIARARVEGFQRPPKDGDWSMTLRVESRRVVPPLLPRVEVISAAPKGPRLDDMIDTLAQLGAASWSPLRAARSVVEPGDNKLDRLARIAQEASKQCGRAWDLVLGPRIDFADALIGAPGVRMILSDAGGQPYAGVSADAVRVLIGPEGGWTPEELAQAREANITIARFGGHTMRIETAATAATAIILAASAT